MKSPKLDERIVELLSDDELRALLKACVPPKGAEPKEVLRHRRDEAIVRIMLETGLRAGEVVGLEIGDIDLTHGVLAVRRGKGGKGRVVPIGPEALLGLDRYLRGAASTGSLRSMTSGSATPAKTSPTMPSTRRCANAPTRRASRASIPTSCATRPRTAGSRREAPSPA